MTRERGGDRDDDDMNRNSPNPFHTELVARFVAAMRGFARIRCAIVVSLALCVTDRII